MNKKIEYLEKTIAALQSCIEVEEKRAIEAIKKDGERAEKAWKELAGLKDVVDDTLDPKEDLDSILGEGELAKIIITVTEKGVSFNGQGTVKEIVKGVRAFLRDKDMHEYIWLAMLENRPECTFGKCE